MEDSCQSGCSADAVCGVFLFLFFCFFVSFFLNLPLTVGSFLIYRKARGQFSPVISFVVD